MKITIIGYGIQGRAQALNLRDSGHDVIIANRDDSYHKNAIKDGFDVVSINQSISSSEIIFLLIPDAVQEEIIQDIIFPNIKDGTLLVFAHGYWLTYEAKNIPQNIDIAMIAPRFPGEPIRKTFKEGGGVPAYYDIFQDFSGQAYDKVFKLGDGLGFSKGGMINLSAKQETELDLFIEQFMAPTFFASAETSFNLLVENGFPKEAVALELYYSGELGAVRTMMGRDGLYEGFKNNASPTCQYGVSSSRNILWSEDMLLKAKKQLERIRSGAFNKELQDQRNSERVVNNFLNSEVAEEIKKAEASVDKIVKKFL